MMEGKATTEYQISIEDFARRVHTYIEQKGKNHHVVFLVDEIGQYIGDDSRLMLNLQTVTEELGKECKGKAWVIVTSQQDIDSITKVKGNDFSKIQGRFDTRLSLSSANVDAVIKKRILDKTDVAAQSLQLLYEQKATIIKNLIMFNDGVEKVLDIKPYRDSKCERYLEQFAEIRQGAEKCNNVSSLRSFADKADALKIRLLNEMDQLDLDEAKKKAEEERRKQEQDAKETGEPFTDRVAENSATYKVRKTKNVSMKSMTYTASWRLENKEDVDKYLDALRESLLAELDENTILNVEI